MGSGASRQVAGPSSCLAGATGLMASYLASGTGARRCLLTWLAVPQTAGNDARLAHLGSQVADPGIPGSQI